MAINIVGVSGKNVSSLGKIVVCPENFFDSQNGTLTENCFGEEIEANAYVNQNKIYFWFKDID